MKILLTTIAASLFLFPGCLQNEEGFTLNGYIQGIDDRTLIYLMDENSIPVDSTFVVGEKFTFTGYVSNPTQFFIFIKSTMDIRPIWIENTAIQFRGKTKKLNEAEIIGSKTETIQEQLDRKLAPLNKELESVYSIYFARYYQYPDSVFDDSVTIQYLAGEKKRFEIIRRFIEENPNNLVSARELNNFKTIFKKEVTSELFARMNDSIVKTDYGLSISEYLTLSRDLKIGDRYIDFEQENSMGEKVKLSDNLGAKYTLIDFWASWCGPCRTSNRRLVDYYRRYRNAGFEIFAVSLDTKRENWLKAIEADTLSWPNVSDLKGYQNEVALTYNVAGLPDSYLLNEEGIIIAIGLRDGTLKMKLEELFNPFEQD